MIDAEHTYRLAFDALLASDPRCDAPVDVALVKQALRVIVQKRRQVFGRGHIHLVWRDAGCGRGHDRHKC